jgi:1,6-anhydro-N-acetylmuramate kinase
MRVGTLVSASAATVFSAVSTVSLRSKGACGGGRQNGVTVRAECAKQLVAGIAADMNTSKKTDGQSQIKAGDRGEE